MQAAYGTLIGQRELFTETIETLADRTTDGTPLAELGLGLGPNINGRNCLECQSKGYTVEESQGIGPCTMCDQQGYISAKQKCDPCKGSGQFKLRSGRMVECRACKGTGERILYRTRHDHVIIAGERYVSFAEAALRPSQVGQITNPLGTHINGFALRRHFHLSVPTTLALVTETQPSICIIGVSRARVLGKNASGTL